MKNIHIIKAIKPDSIAQEMELCPGDCILKINDQEIQDVFDYQYLIEDTYIELLVQKEDGEQWLLEIDKDIDEDLGIEFDSGLMDGYKSCSNRCIFCFIDQMPKGMRETLYFKDDDSRLSFLQGNYITMTNMKDKDLDRIIKYRLAPINISVHTTNPELRCKMLHNRFADKIMGQIQKLYDNEILMNAQIVLCKNYNDKEELERSIKELSAFLPYMESVSVVPIGMTKYREGLTPVEPFNKDDACEIIDTIEKWQDKLYKEYGTHFIHAGDELYLLAERDVPEASRYDGYIQLENGVGMMRLLLDETAEVIDGINPDLYSKAIKPKDIITGKLAYDHIMSIVNRLKSKVPGLDIRVHCITNNFFGESITVSGLLTGGDIIEQLKEKSLTGQLLMPVNLLRSQEEVLLDDVTLDQIEKALQVEIHIIQSSGKDLIDTILK